MIPLGLYRTQKVHMRQFMEEEDQKGKKKKSADLGGISANDDST